ncbi:MAG TPA: L-threonylcarbamoyladenylate synthase [Candidatus Xenobia bacterium]|nr:L-threonylcarbamoyladenylate synthase [Candidatus Xenobia bacterium]
MAEILTVSPDNPDSRSIAHASELIRRGEVVVIPTDTFYGLAADPFNLMAVARVYDIKGRPERKALPILVATTEQAQDLAADLPDPFFPLVERFWPGALTIVLSATRRLPLKVTGNTGRVALRLPDSKVTAAVIKAVGGPVTGTSANLSGFAACVSAPQVVKQLGERVPLILDGGESKARLASTVVELRSDDEWIILREGPISEADIRAAIEGEPPE